MINEVAPPEVLGGGEGRVLTIVMAHEVQGHHCDGQGPGAGLPTSAIVV